MRDGWVRTTLGEVAEIVMGQSPPGSTYNLEGRGLPFIQGSAEFGSRSPRPLRWCSEPRKIAEPGDLLVSVRAPVGDTNTADQRTAIGRGLAILRGRDGVLTDFLALAIESKKAALLERSSTGMFTSITRAKLSSLEIRIPSLAEQKRIVDLISAVDAVRDAASHLHQKASAARSNLCAALLSGEHLVPESYDELLGAV